MQKEEEITPITELENIEENENNLDSIVAEIVSVSFSGSEGNYSFSVGISSPDTGCDQYADWWEVITEDGELIYRRILGHSHVNEQPFIRSGGGVTVNGDQTVIVRAHMNEAGYGIQVFKGSTNEGFEPFATDNEFANGLDLIEPLPTGCAF